MGGKTFQEAFGIPATTQKQQERLEHELRNRPQNCDADPSAVAIILLPMVCMAWCQFAERTPYALLFRPGQ
jgi:hypothetical protein